LLYFLAMFERVEWVLQGRILKGFQCWLSLHFQCEGLKKKYLIL
jgi:hypothetical protein